MKHYMGYGVPVSGKDRTPSSITEQDMREKHFAPLSGNGESGCPLRDGELRHEQRSAFPCQL